MTDEVIGRLIIEDSGGVGSVSGGGSRASSSNKDITKMRKSLEQMSGVMLGPDMTKFLKIGMGAGGALAGAIGTTGATVAAVAAAATAIVLDSVKMGEKIDQVTTLLDLPGAGDEEAARDAVTESLEDEENVASELVDAHEMLGDTVGDIDDAITGFAQDFREADMTGMFTNVLRFLKNVFMDFGTDMNNARKALNNFASDAGGSSMSAFSNDRYQSIVSAEGETFGYQDDYLQQSVMTSDEYSSQQASINPFANPATTNVSRGSSSNDQFTQ